MARAARTRDNRDELHTLEGRDRRVCANLGQHAEEHAQRVPYAVDLLGRLQLQGPVDVLPEAVLAAPGGPLQAEDLRLQAHADRAGGPLLVRLFNGPVLIGQVTNELTLHG